MADFTDIASNEDMVAIANGIRAVTRTEEGMTIPEMPERLLNIKVVMADDKICDFSTGERISLGTFDTVIRHLFIVSPKTTADLALLAETEPELELTYNAETGELFLEYAVAQEAAMEVKLTIVDLLLSSENDSRGFLVNRSAKFDKLVTEWSEVLSDNNYPSEKLVKTTIEDYALNVVKYKDVWNTTGATDFSALNSYRPMKSGWRFECTGTGCTISGIKFSPGDFITLKQDVAIDEEILATMFAITDNSESATKEYVDFQLATKEPLLPEAPADPERSFLNGNKEWAPMVIGGGSSAAPLYLTDDASETVPSYKQWKYTLPETETSVSVVVNSSTSPMLMESYLFDADFGSEIVDAGKWTATFTAFSSSIGGNTNLRIVLFKRDALGNETDLYAEPIDGDDIGSVTPKQYTLEGLKNGVTVSPTDRLGMKVYAMTTRALNTTVTYYKGNGRGVYVNTPLALRHNQLREPNENPTTLHVTSEQLARLNASILLLTSTEMVAQEYTLPEGTYCICTAPGDYETSGFYMLGSTGWIPKGKFMTKLEIGSTILLPGDFVADGTYNSFGYKATMSTPLLTEETPEVYFSATTIDNTVAEENMFMIENYSVSIFEGGFYVYAKKRPLTDVVIEKMEVIG